MSEPTSDSPITQMLASVAAGEESAAARLLPLIYEDLQRLARARMARSPAGQTLQPTALVHEAFLKLVGARNPSWNGRNHFFGAAAMAMRDILVDQARRKATTKRGGDVSREFSEPEIVFEEPVEDVLAVNEALQRLESVDPRKAKIVMLRYFAGLDAAETAAAMEMSERTLDREWRFAKAWLKRQLSGTTDVEVDRA